MIVKDIPIYGRHSIFEYILEKRDSSMKIEQKKEHTLKIKRKNLSLDDYARLYYNENLIEVNGQKYPLILINEFNDLEKQKILVEDRPYEVPQRFKKFVDSALREKLMPGMYNSIPVVRIGKIKTEGETIRLNIQKSDYFSFIGTNLSQDDYLSQFDESFEDGQTLREHEIENGKAVELHKSNLANVFGMMFSVLNEKEKFFILDIRNRNLIVNPGICGLLGGTPRWDDLSRIGAAHFSRYLGEHYEEEMKEELCLNKNEIKFKKSYWLNELTRAPLLLACLTTDVSMEEIAKRCEKSEMAKKEHGSLLMVPATAETIYSLAKDSKGYKLNHSCIPGLYLALKN